MSFKWLNTWSSLLRFVELHMSSQKFAGLGLDRHLQEASPEAMKTIAQWKVCVEVLTLTMLLFLAKNVFLSVNGK